MGISEIIGSKRAVEGTRSDHMPFTEFHVCPKCGNQSVELTYNPRGKHYEGGGVEVPHPEHLVVTCTRCKYYWRQMCKDASS